MICYMVIDYLQNESKCGWSLHIIFQTDNSPPTKRNHHFRSEKNEVVITVER